MGGMSFRYDASSPKTPKVKNRFRLKRSSLMRALSLKLPVRSPTMTESLSERRSRSSSTPGSRTEELS